MRRRASDLVAVRGLRVGHATTTAGDTGVTAVLVDDGAPTVVDVRGGASGTYDTASLALDATFGRRWGIFFSGGSLFGLDAAAGVRRALLESGAGATAFGTKFRLAPVSGAVIFDLPQIEGPVPSYEPLGYAAAAAAGRSPCGSGRIGAGAGATVAKYLGRPGFRHGGLGSAARPLGSGHSVGALVVVNAAGAIRDPDSGTWVAVARDAGGRRVPPVGGQLRRLQGRGTTVGLVATDLALSRPQLARVAAIAHAGVARTVVPHLTSVDGDTLFALTTSHETPERREEWPGAIADAVGRLAAEAAVDAVLAAVRPPG